jgi:uncharacterized protein YjbI with pentapeptide repeats
MANDEHIALLKQGDAAWNEWRLKNPDIRPDLSWGTASDKVDLSKADLSQANLVGPDLSKANLSGANLSKADLSQAYLVGADLSKANLSKTNLFRTNLGGANLSKANLSGADFQGASLYEANLSGADLGGARLVETNLIRANLSGVNLRGAELGGAHLMEANVSGANLSGADLQCSVLVDANLTNADITGCYVWGVSAWGIKLEGTKQHNLFITTYDEPSVTVDNIEVAQFVHLLLNNQKIRHVIDTVGKKGVLLLGRFTEGRMQILEQLREKLRSLGFVPMVFNFDKPETKDFTETVRLLANLSKFVIVDITNPRSTPLELQATVPDYMVPFVPILQEGEQPFAMFVDLQNKYDWVLKPIIVYSSVDRLVEVFEEEIVRPAEAKFDELLKRRTEKPLTKTV